MNEVIREFLIETHENLSQLDLDLVTLEREPSEAETLARVFRTLHTVKGTAGFLGLQKLQALAHAAENMLSRLRAGELLFDPPIANSLLAVVDAVRHMLRIVEATESDGDNDFTPLIQSLDRLRKAGDAPQANREERRGTRDEGIDVTGEGSSLVPPPSSLLRIAPMPSLATPVPTPEGPPTEAAEIRAPVVADSSIRVDVGLLDKLMNLVGELVLARNQIMQFSSSQESTPFQGTVQRLNLLTTELQAGVMKTRMQPIGTIWSKFPRVVRDLALACGKRTRLEMEGQETELDKTIIEAIRDPLTHLVRNAIDHGIETPAERLNQNKSAEGRLVMHAFHEGGKVIIRIADDGKGIDPERIRAKAVQAKLITSDQADRLNARELVNLIFLPGFSTADKVTQFSGRGVGMDVVRTNIEKIGGTIAIESHPGRGTVVEMKIPLTLAIIPALTITSAGDRYAIPQVSLLELVRLEAEQASRGIEQIHGVPVYRLRGNLLPLVYLNEQLYPENRGEGRVVRSEGKEDINIVVLQADDRQFGLVVDAIRDTEEIVVKPLQKQLKGISVFAGATIMGDGKVALILDVLGLAQKASVISGTRERALTEKTASAVESRGEQQTVLLFSTRGGGRMAIPLSLVARLEEFPRSTLERVGPLDVVQYRNEILPLFDVDRVLKSRVPKTEGRSSKFENRRVKTGSPERGGSVQVVVYAGSSQRFGLIVDRIIDIVEETIVSRSLATRPGILFTAVIHGRVTEFLDLEGIVRSIEPELLEQPQTVGVEA
jgi:two-component system, chemotaxis family, sensor kinase CheA